MVSSCWPVNDIALDLVLVLFPLRRGLPPTDWDLFSIAPGKWQAVLVGLGHSGSGREEGFLFPGVTKTPGNALVLVLKDL